MFTPDLLKDKKILITGGGTGLGKSIGRRYLELGAELVICGRRKDVLDATADEFRSTCCSTMPQATSSHAQKRCRRVRWMRC